MTELTITVYGKPITQGSKTRTRWGMRDDNGDTLKPWREAVKTAALDTRDGQQPPLDGPLSVFITFTFARSKGHWRTGRNAHLLRDNAPTYPVGRQSGDIDKLQRACFDALTDAGIWGDDAQVAGVFARKVYVGDSRGLPIPGAVITVTALDAGYGDPAGEATA